MSVDDDDTAGLTLSTTDLERERRVERHLHGEVLDTQPTGDVTVTVGQTGTANTDVTVDTDTSNGGNQDSLTFTDLELEHGADSDGERSRR